MMNAAQVMVHINITSRPGYETPGLTKGEGYAPPPIIIFGGKPHSFVSAASRREFLIFKGSLT